MTDENNAKKKALELALAQIEKKFGKGAAMTLGEGQHVKGVETVSSGAISLDIALGGGYPKGRIVEIYGPESSGKTTLALHAIAEVQKAGGQCAFIDAEHALDPAYARKIGVSTDELIISQPDDGEQALSIAETLVSSSAVDLIVVDSVAALTPKAEIEGSMGDSHMGLQARLMSQALRKLAGICSKSGTTIIFLNQIRMKIGVMFGNPETTTGGNALKFYASQRLDIRRTGKIEEGSGAEKVMTGNRTKVKVLKNKIAPPFRIAEFDIVYNKGIEPMGDLLDTAVNLNVVTRAGASYSWGSEKLGVGRAKVVEMLKNNEEMVGKLHEAVMEAAKEANLD